MTPLPDAEIERLLSETGGWHRGDGSSIVRELDFADFAAAIAFVNSVAELAEAANHHPDILVHGYNRCASRSPPTPRAALTRPTSRSPARSTLA